MARYFVLACTAVLANIGGLPACSRSEYQMDVALLDGGAPSQWRVVAKDGMPTPASQSGVRPSSLRIAPGEIYDLEIAPRAGATLALRYAIADSGPGIRQSL